MLLYKRNAWYVKSQNTCDLGFTYRHLFYINSDDFGLTRKWDEFYYSIWTKAGITNKYSWDHSKKWWLKSPKWWRHTVIMPINSISYSAVQWLD